MTSEQRRELVERYADGVAAVERALDGFPPEALSARPFPGKWSAREIVHHLADSENISAQRLRKLVVEDKPVIQGYDQEVYATRLRYNERDLAPALASFRAARATTAQILAQMVDADWEREGWHSESGRYTAETWLEIYAAHAHGHADQIRRLRDAAKA